MKIVFDKEIKVYLIMGVVIFAFIYFLPDIYQLINDFLNK